jgi:non-ribosomal peptide synthetase component F
MTPGTLPHVGIIATRFAASLAEHSDQIAIELPAQGSSMSYGDLADAAARWATRFADVDRPWVLHMAKSPTLYQLEVAAFRYGRSFCPVDLLNPVGRVASIASQLERVLVITDQPDRAEALEALGFDVELVSGDLVSGDLPTSPTAPLSGTDPRYFISTSGTTGAPKLVEVSHDATEKFIAWAVPYYEVAPGSRWAQFSNIGFDLSIVDVLTSIAAGATLVVMSTMGETARLNRVVSDYGITHWHSVPSVIAYLVRGGRSLDQVRMMSFCGEPLLRSQCVELRRVAPQARLINTYGPTEGPLFCTAHEVTDSDMADDDLATMPIGTAIPGWQLDFTADDQGLRLTIRAERLAEGYHGISDAAFGWETREGVVWQTFDTGDYMRTHGDHLVFSHRRDRMVKIAGIRLDLGDVTDACLRCGIDEPVVMLHDGALVVFYAGVDGERQSMEGDAQIDRSSRLRQVLPDYAVPSRYEFVAAMPRNANGKIDRGDLAARLTADGT